MARGNVSLTIALDSKGNLEAQISKAVQAVDKMGARAQVAGMTIADVAGAWTLVKDAAGMAQRAVDATWKHITAGEQAIQVGNSFAAMYDNASVALGELKRATGGAFDETTIQGYANKYAAAGLTLEQTTAAMGAATKIAAATGQDYAQVLQQVSEAALKGEAGELKRYGVMVNNAKAEADYAASVGLTVAQLSEEDKIKARQIATVEALTEKSAEYGDVQVASTQQISAAWGNVVSNLEVKVTQVLLPVLQKVPEILENIAAGVADIGSASDAIGDWYSGVVGAADEAAKATHGFEYSMGEMVGTMLQAGASLDDVMAALDRTGSAAMMGAENIQFLGDVTRGIVGGVEAGKDALDALNVQMALLDAKRLPDWMERLISHKEPESTTAAKPKKGGKGQSDAAEYIRADFDLQKAMALQGANELERIDIEHMFRLQEIETSGRTSRVIALEKELADLEWRNNRKNQIAKEEIAAFDSASKESARILEERAEEESRIAEAKLEADQVLADERRRIAEDYQARLSQLAADSQSLTDVASFFGSLEERNATIQGLAGMSALLGQIGSDFASLSKGAPASIAALGKVGAAFSADKRAQAAIAGAFETAASVASFATLDFVGGAMHAAAAGLYFAIAGGAGGGASGGAAARPAAVSRGRVAAGGGGSLNSGSGGQTQVFNINAPVFGTSMEGNRMVARAGAKVAGSGHETMGAGF